MLGQRRVEVFGVVSHGHRQMGCLMMSGWRMGRSGEIGCVNGLRFEYVCRRDEFSEIGLSCGEVIDGYLDEGNLGGLD